MINVIITKEDDTILTVACDLVFLNGKNLTITMSSINAISGTINNQMNINEAKSIIKCNMWAWKNMDLTPIDDG